MEPYKFYLPLYEEPSGHFKAFINDFLQNQSYVAQLTVERLNFLPFATKNVEYKAAKASLPAKAFKHPNQRMPKRIEISKFATKFNILSSLYSVPQNKRKCKFYLELIENTEMFPNSRRILQITFFTDDLNIRKTIDNHLELIG